MCSSEGEREARAEKGKPEQPRKHQMQFIFHVYEEEVDT